MLYNCKVCKSPERKNINRLLLTNVTYKSISDKYDISPVILSKHKKYHLTREVSKSMVSNMKELRVPELKPITELPQLDKLGDCVSYVYNEFLDIHLRAKERSDDKVNMQALRSIMDSIGVIVKGKELEFAYRSQASWDKVLPYIIQAVKDMPEATDAIAYAIDKARITLEAQDVL